MANENQSFRFVLPNRILFSLKIELLERNNILCFLVGIYKFCSHAMVLYLVAVSHHADCKPQVVKHGAYGAIMMTHDMKTLFQRGLVIAGGESLVKVINKGKMGVV